MLEVKNIAKHFGGVRALKGVSKPVIGARYPLSRINEAAKKLEEGEVVGRIILTR